MTLTEKGDAGHRRRLEWGGTGSQTPTATGLGPRELPLALAAGRHSRLCQVACLEHQVVVCPAVCSNQLLICSTAPQVAIAALAMLTQQPAPLPRPALPGCSGPPSPEAHTLCLPRDHECGVPREGKAVHSLALCVWPEGSARGGMSKAPGLRVTQAPGFSLLEDLTLHFSRELCFPPVLGAVVPAPQGRAGRAWLRKSWGVLTIPHHQACRGCLRAKLLGETGLARALPSQEHTESPISKSLGDLARCLGGYWRVGRHGVSVHV